jgi:regulator of RNase E activity RraA
MAINLAALAKFDTPTICNTIELFEVRPRTAGYMDGRVRACFPEMAPAVGYAATATMRCAHPRREGDVYGSLDEQVARFSELAGPPIVVFQDLDDPPVAATFGEIMCTTYQAFGAVGLVTSGAARDVDQVRRLGFPAFSNGVICSHGYSHIVDLHRPASAVLRFTRAISSTPTPMASPQSRWRSPEKSPMPQPSSSRRKPSCWITSSQARPMCATSARPVAA